MLRTPLMLQFLIAAYVDPNPPSNIDSTAGERAIIDLREAKLIYRSGRWYHTTDKGEFFLKHLLSIPFPVETWRIPNDQPS